MMSSSTVEEDYDHDQQMGSTLNEELAASLLNESQQPLDFTLNDEPLASTSFNGTQQQNSKLAVFRNVALWNCFDFNKKLMEKRRGKTFYEQHTRIKMVPGNRYYKLKPEYTRPHSYPVALIDGQYTDAYKKYTPEELKKLPFKSVLVKSDFPVMLRQRPPPNFVVPKTELESDLFD